MKILVNMWPGFVFGHSGDFYANVEITALRQQFPDLEFLFVRSPTAIASGNARVLFLKALEKSHLLDFRSKTFVKLYFLQLVNFIPRTYLQRCGADLIFAHAQYPWPLRGFPIPVVAAQEFASDRHMAMAGILDLLPLEIRAKRWSLQYAKVILTQTPNSKQRVERYLPETMGRVRQAPLYMPYLEPVSSEGVVHKHRADATLQVLFVGGEARRKGLPQLVEALRRLPRSVRNRLQVTVVSNFRDGAMAIDEELRVVSGVGVAEVLRLMRAAHIFAFPTLYESYGRVIVEAMASGCSVIVPNVDPQDWMIDFGKAGVGVDSTSPEEIAAALIMLAENREARLQHALSALDRFQTVFHHRVVGLLYRQAFEAAIETPRS